VVVWNSHAFNLTSIDSTMNQYLNLELAAPEDQLYPALAIFDAGSIFIPNVPPFETREYCRTYTAPVGARVFVLGSHTHQRGVRFRIWAPPNARCVPASGTCLPGEPSRLIYTSTDYADPVQLELDPPMALDSADAGERTFLYCSLYDNGATPDSPAVKQQSASPFPALIGAPGGPCGYDTVACLNDGARRGQLCGGRHSKCDSAQRAGDGVCDACPVVGGVTTEDEMFILTGSFYVPEP
jgi:hypothetical protein